MIGYPNIIVQVRNFDPCIVRPIRDSVSHVQYTVHRMTVFHPAHIFHQIRVMICAVICERCDTLFRHILLNHLTRFERYTAHVGLFRTLI